MPITVEIVDKETAPETLDAVFLYFTEVDERFSTYKDTSEISQLNEALIANGGAPQHVVRSTDPRTEQIPRKEPAYSDLAMSEELKEVFKLAEQTKQETNGYFDITKPNGQLDPSGIVKGWAIQNAAEMLLARGVTNFFIDAGGDIQSHGKNSGGKEWSVGIRNPFNQKEIVKIIYPQGRGIATSGSYERGSHIYNPHNTADLLADIISITVVGPNVLEADRFATAAFAMGTTGVTFIENLPGFEAYSIDKNGTATMTSGFEALTTPA